MVQMKRLKHYENIKEQAMLLQNFVHDILDTHLMSKNDFVIKTKKFKSDETFKQIIRMFSEETRAKNIKLQMQTKFYLQGPFEQTSLVQEEEEEGEAEEQKE